MPGTKEIRNKIKSVQNTRKITKAMEMVAASKMRKAQERMRATRPYGEKIRNVAAHISHANPEYRHPFVVSRDSVKRVGLIVITTDKGLCGGLNTNVLRMTLGQYKEWQAQGEEIEVCCFGNKGLGFMQRLGANIVSQVVQLGDRPQLDKLIGAVKVMLDGYIEDRFDRLMLVYTRFINTMKQEPVIEQLLPLVGRAPGRARRQLGLPLRAGSQGRARPGADALRRNDHLPGGGGEHGFGAVGADGGDEGGVRQCRHPDRRTDPDLQQESTGRDHQGTLGNRRRRRRRVTE